MFDADPLSDVVAMLKPEAYGFRGLDVGGAWSLRLTPDEVIRCYAIRTGECGLWLENGVPPVHLVAGDFVLLPRGNGLVMGSEQNAPPIDLDAFFATADGETVIVAGGGGCSGLGGYFSLGGGAASRLLAALPPVVRLETGGDHTGLWWLVERLMGELRAPRPGGRLIAEHLSQTLLVEALRLHLTAGRELQGGWLGVLADPQLQRALGAIHAEPGRLWTLDALARVAGLSRSAFAQRFAKACGEPAMSYLTRWRMLLATEQLGQGTAIGAVARKLGYGSESAFGAAFRRVVGVPPGTYRRRP